MYSLGLESILEFGISLSEITFSEFLLICGLYIKNTFADILFSAESGEVGWSIA